MSDLKISQLPLFPSTGNTTGFYVVANNAGETITYKMTKETLIGASGTSGSSGTSGTSGSSGTSGTSGSSGTSGINGVSGTSGSSGTSGINGVSGTSGSSGTSGASGDSFFIESDGLNSFVNDWYSSGDTNGDYQFLVSGQGNQITQGSKNTGILSGSGSKITAGTSANSNGVLFGIANYIGSPVTAGNTISGSTIAGGINNIIFTDNSNYNFIGGGEGNSVANSLNSGVLAGYDNTIADTQNAGIIGAQFSTIGASGGGHNAIAGCDGVSINSGYNQFIGASYSGPSINGGEENCILSSIGGTQISSASNCFIAASQGFQINGGFKNAGIAVEAGGWQSPRFSFAGGGYNLSTGNLQGNQHAALGYENATFDSSSYPGGYIYHSAVIGVKDVSMEHDTSAIIASSGGTSLYDRTLHTDNQHTFKTESFDVVNAGAVSGSIDVDLSLGSLYYFEITGNTTPNFINWREGQKVQFWVFNNGSFSIPTITISGGGDVYAKAGAVNPTNNERTGYYGTIVNGDMYLDEHLNFQAL